MNKTTEKSLGFAIGLNLLLPGAGYVYLRKLILGIFALLFIMLIYKIYGFNILGSIWIFMNAIMAIDMYILFNKDKVQLIKVDNINEKEIVYITKKGNGMIAGIIACVLAVLGILFLGTIFVPLAIVVALFGTIIAIKNANGAGIGVNILAWALILVGFITSPVLLAIIISASN